MTTFVDNQTVISASWLNQVDALLQGSLVTSAASGGGVKVDLTTPTYAWADLIGPLYPDAAGANAPALTAWAGGAVRRWAFSVGDKVDCEFHIPHDYAPGTDLYLHMHWSHNGSAISGTITANCAVTYAKGHSQAVFSGEKTVVLTQAVNITNVPQFSHEIVEAQLSTPGGAAAMLDTNLIEPDGVIGCNLTMATIPTITGGSTGEPFVFFIDIHYQTTNVGTKNKAPTFYG